MSRNRINMRIQYLSDMHLEFLKTPPLIKAVAPVLCLLGDIGYPFSNIYQEFLYNINSNPKFKKIFIISGNHEYYSKEKSINEVDIQISDIIKNNNLNKISFLNNTKEYYDNHLFVGTTLWSHISDPNHLINDFISIKDMTVDKYNELHHDAKNFMSSSISNTNKKTILLTHYLPSYTIIHPKYSKYSKYNQCFASECDHLINDPVSLWLYGHTHTPKIDYINKVPVICNPIGYPEENKDANFEKIVEI